ncbi:hypothetical protein XaraCFBP7407_06840, partial [Xanthomonas arboricola pv. arracaciae]
WMPRKSLQGRTCGVSCEGGRARTCRDGRCAWFSTKQPATGALSLPVPGPLAAWTLPRSLHRRIHGVSGKW